MPQPLLAKTWPPSPPAPAGARCRVRRPRGRRRPRRRRRRRPRRIGGHVARIALRRPCAGSRSAPRRRPRSCPGPCRCRAPRRRRRRGRGRRRRVEPASFSAWQVPQLTLKSSRPLPGRRSRCASQPLSTATRGARLRAARAALNRDRFTARNPIWPGWRPTAPDPGAWIGLRRSAQAPPEGGGPDGKGAEGAAMEVREGMSDRGADGRARPHAAGRGADDDREERRRRRRHRRGVARSAGASASATCSSRSAAARTPTRSASATT